MSYFSQYPSLLMSCLPNWFSSSVQNPDYHWRRLQPFFNIIIARSIKQSGRLFKFKIYIKINNKKQEEGEEVVLFRKGSTVQNVIYFYTCCKLFIIVLFILLIFYCKCLRIIYVCTFGQIHFILFWLCFSIDLFRIDTKVLDPPLLNSKTVRVAI